jgi:glycosyltransferase involved in cell wall biosynthesis
MKNISAKILMVGQTPPPIGGVTEQIRILVNSDLSNLVSLFHISPGRDTNCIGIRKVANSALFILKVLFFSIYRKADVVHLHTSSYTGFYEKGIIAVILRILTKKVLLQIHGGDFDRFYEYSNFRWFIRLTLSIVNKVLVLSDGWKDKISEFAQHADINVYNNSIDMGIFSNIYLQRRNRETFRILFAGGILKAKGVFDILEIAQSFKGKKVSFDLLGDGTEYNKVKTMIDEFGLKDMVFLHGWKTGDEKLRYFKNASIFILPSYIEGQPVAILEAMAAGLPVVSTTVGSIPEIVSDKRGILCKPGDIQAYKTAIDTLIKNDSLRESMRVDAVQYVSTHHDINSQVQRLLQIYCSITRKN